MDSDGSDQQLFFPHSGNNNDWLYQHNPRWGDHGKIAFNEMISWDNWVISVIDENSSTDSYYQITIDNAAVRSNRIGSWAFDGRKILYSADHDTEGYGTFMMDADGSNQLMVAPGASSADFFQEQIVEIPVFEPVAANPIMSDVTEFPSRMFRDEERYRLYFLRKNSSGSYPYDFNLDLKISDLSGLTAEGLNFEETIYNVISEAQSGKTFNYYATELVENGTYRVWHSATNDWNIAGMLLHYSESSDGSSFSGQGLVTFSLEPYPEYDSRGIKFPYILKSDGIYHMYYQAFPGYTTGPPDYSFDYTIAYATSADGVDWTKHGVVIDSGEDGTFDDHSLSTPCVIKNEDLYEMFYCASDGETTGTGYAVSSDGLSWIKHGKVDTVDGCPVGVFKDSEGYELWYVTRDGTYLGELNVAKAPLN